MDAEKKVQVLNILTAYKLDMITFQEAEKRMSNLFNEINFVKIDKSENHKLN